MNGVIQQDNGQESLGEGVESIAKVGVNICEHFALSDLLFSLF